jgi:Glyoxalase/Bleomycin resistance protein/Dioxygenase superfamily
MVFSTGGLMRFGNIGGLGALAVTAVAAGGPGSSTFPETAMNKVTPIITVEAVEPCLTFWTDRLGFDVTVSVPHEGGIGFAILVNGGVELMYQSRASIDADLGASGGPPDLGTELERGTSTLFIEVKSIDDVVDKLGDAEVVVPRRKTFYGMDEIFVRAPCGTLVGFAAQLAKG